MGADRFRQPLKIISAFEDADDSPAGKSVRHLAEARGCPAEILPRQGKAGQWIAPVRVETGGNEDQLRLEPLERRNDPGGAADRADGLSLWSRRSGSRL